MTTLDRPRWVACTLFVVALTAAPAAAQSFRRPPAPIAEPVFARVTITNQTDVAVAFQSYWRDEPARREVLDPGRSVTLETTFRAGDPKPELTVIYRSGAWYRPDVVTVPSGHVDPGTDNPGRVYDFYRKRSNVGQVVTLQAR